MDRAMLDLQGLWVPIVTPFTATGDLDVPSLSGLADRLLADGAAGLVALGTTGEPATLTAAERVSVAAVCGEASARHERPLIVGAGSNSTIGTIEEIDRLCSGAPVGAALVVVPYYTRPSTRAVIEHFAMVAEASPVPIVAYNIPYRTGIGVDAEAWFEIGSHPNVIGLKQAAGSLDLDTLALLRRLPDGFRVLCGDDAFIAPTVLMGGAGAIAAAAHLHTRTFVELVDAARAGDVERARSLAEALLPVVDAGFAEPNPAVWKGALHRRGEITTDVLRRPMTAASQRATSALLAASDAASAALAAV